MFAPLVLADPTLVLTSTHGGRLGGYRHRDGLGHWTWTRGVWPRGAFEARPGATPYAVGPLAEVYRQADDVVAPHVHHDALEHLRDARRLYRMSIADGRDAGLLAVDEKGLWWVRYEGFHTAALPGPLWFEPTSGTARVGPVGCIRLQRRYIQPVSPSEGARPTHLTPPYGCRG